MADSEAEQRPSLGRVLVVDDDPDLRAVVEAILGAGGYEVILAADGHEALEVLSGGVDVALVDSAMSGVDGAGFLPRARQAPQGADVAILFFSVESNPASVAAALRAGADGYLVKPISPEELVARVEVAVRTKRAKEHLRAENAVLQRLSRVDRLTGLFNRFHMESELARVRAESLRREDPWFAMLVDLDGFKAVNDQFGHRAGDEVLMVVAHALQGVGRAGDLVGRWGGEEFLVLCPSTGSDGVRAFAQRLLDCLRVLEVRAGDDWVSVTASIGAAPGGTEPWSKTLESADAALYQAKAAGRDRLVIAEAQAGPPFRPGPLR